MYKTQDTQVVQDTRKTTLSYTQKEELYNMRTYSFMDGKITITTDAPIYAGDIVKADNNEKKDKNGKSTLCTIRVLTIKECVPNVFYQGTCELVQVASASNILDYNLYVVEDIQTTDLFQTSTMRFFLDNDFAIYCQSSGYRDEHTGDVLPLSSQLKLLEHRVNYYDSVSLKDNRVTALFRGNHKDFIEWLSKAPILDDEKNVLVTKEKANKVLEYYNLLIKNARTK